MIDELQAELLREGALKASEALDLCANLPIIGIGRGRIAITRDNDSVYKLAWRDKGVADNAIEERIWNTADDYLKSMLADIIDLTPGGVLIQRYCAPPVFNRGQMDLLVELSKYGISDIAINLGMLDNRLVCFDYAFISPNKFLELFGEEAQ